MRPAYSLERDLGGGLARVFLATETALGRRVVVKVLPPESTADISIERFRREIRLAAGLQHPHIVPLARGIESHEIITTRSAAFHLAPDRLPDVFVGRAAKEPAYRARAT